MTPPDLPRRAPSPSPAQPIARSPAPPLSHSPARLLGLSPLRAATLVCALWAGGVMLATALGLVFEVNQNGWPVIARPVDLLPAAGFAIASFGLRFLRWHLLARRLAPGLRIRPSFEIGTIGFALAMTPGRAGEALKLLLLRRHSDVPVASSASVLLLEKVTEAAGFALLALGASLFLPWTEGLRAGMNLALIVGALVAVLLAIALRGWLIAQATAAMPRLRRRLPRLHRLLARPELEKVWADVAHGGERVLGWPGLISALGLSLAARLCDGLAIYWVAGLFGVDLPLAAAWFIIGSAGFVGGVTMLPGGAGAVEATAIGLFLVFGSGPAAAVASVLTSRILIFWAWIGLGIALALSFPAADGGRRTADEAPSLR